jgi:GT2 family glycosyltransferase
MIPVIGIPVLNRGDLLLRCIRSIDYPYGKLVIVNNGADPGVCAVLEQLQRADRDRLLVLAPGCNLGVAASWNRIIRELPDADYWLLVGNDMMFAREDLLKIHRFVTLHASQVTCPANWGHSLFAVTNYGWRKIGSFDENFWPGYSEDQDHMYRVKLSGEPWADVPDIHATHGEAPSWGSHTVYADPELFQVFKKYQENNLMYYREKWGGAPGEEQFTHPYNDPDLDWTQWRWDRDLAEAVGRKVSDEG